jgi:cytochrome b subunit of formate dehydrogenase
MSFILFSLFFHPVVNSVAVTTQWDAFLNFFPHFLKPALLQQGTYLWVAVLVGMVKIYCSRMGKATKKAGQACLIIPELLSLLFLSLSGALKRALSVTLIPISAVLLVILPALPLVFDRQGSDFLCWLHA